MEALPGIADGSLQGEKQDDSQSCYAAKLQKSEALIDWSKPARQILAQINAFNAWPVAQTPVDIRRNGEPQMMRIWQAQCVDIEAAAGEPGKVVRCDKKGIDVVTGEGGLRLLKIQLPGKKPMDVQAFVNASDISGLTLG